MKKSGSDLPLTGSKTGQKVNMQNVKSIKTSKTEIDPLVLKLMAEITPSPLKPNGLSDEQKISAITEKFRDIMEILGLDLENESLSETPGRVARMYVRELFAGLRPQNFPKITAIKNAMEYHEPVIVRGISLMSTCEHHFVTIKGEAQVAYIPNDQIIGLSKINRIVRFFSRQPQVQERLTKQIADALQFLLNTEHVAVRIEADHFCVQQRGVEDTHSTTVTMDFRGRFRMDADLAARLK